MRSTALILALAVAAPACALNNARSSVAAFFRSPAPDVLEKEDALVPNQALPTVDELLEPFVDQFRWPYIKTNEDGGQTTRRYDLQTPTTVGDALKLVRDEKISIVLRFEELAVDQWPTSLVNLVPEELLAELTTNHDDVGTTVHAYISAPSTAALPEHRDMGDILVVQVAGEKSWALDGTAATMMRPGDALWIPAQTEHVARATDQTSAHLTIHRVGGKHLPTSRRRLLEEPPNGWIRNPEEDEWDQEVWGPDQCLRMNNDDHDCYDCNCAECNLCSDYGSFCTTSASQMALKNPCCVHEQGGDLDDEMAECQDADTVVDAWNYRLTGKEDGSKQGKGCEWVKKSPGDRCRFEGVFVETVMRYPNRDTKKVQDYFGLPWLYENQKKYSAWDACPIACEGHSTACSADANVVDRASGEAFCERSGFDTPEKCHACGDCCRWDYHDDGCYYNNENPEPSANCPRNDGPEEPDWDAMNDDEGYYGPDKCVYGDRECSDCNCASCNLCVDNYGLSGSFCTTSAAQMTMNEPCWKYLLDEGYTTQNNPAGTRDAYTWRTNGASGPEDKDCDWIGADAATRCSHQGVFIEGAIGSSTPYYRPGDQISLAWLFANQPAYPASEACPLACCFDDPDWAYTRDNGVHDCAHVAENPSERCDREDYATGTFARDMCPKACGTCVSTDQVCQDDVFWHHTYLRQHCGWVKQDPAARCNLKSEDGVKAKKACPLACGGCSSDQCIDDPFYEYQPGKGCKHVAELPEKRCARPDDTWKTKEACCATCKGIEVKMYATGDVGAGAYVPWSIVVVASAAAIVAAATFHRARKASGVDEKEPLLHRSCSA